MLEFLAEPHTLDEMTRPPLRVPATRRALVRRRRRAAHRRPARRSACCARAEAVEVEPGRFQRTGAADERSGSPTSACDRAARRAVRARLRGAVADPARRHPAPAGRARRARPGGDGHRQDGGVRAAGAAAIVAELDRRHQRGRAPVVLVLVPTRELAVQVSEAMYRYGRERRRRRGADLRRPAHRPPARCAARRRRRRRGDARPGHRPPPAGHARRSTTSASSCSTRPTRCSTWASPRTSRRSSSGTPAERQTVLFSATLPPRVRRASPPATSATPSGSRSSRTPTGRRTPARSSQRAYVVARAHKPAALGRVLDVEAPQAALVFCRTRNGGRSADRDAQRSRLPGRGAARRHQPGGPGPRHGPPAHGHGRAADRHRRGRARPRRRRADPRRQLRRPADTRCLRAPHRPGRPGRSRRRGDHAGRAARDAPAAQHRAGHGPVDRRRAGAQRRRPAVAPARR